LEAWITERPGKDVAQAADRDPATQLHDEIGDAASSETEPENTEQEGDRHDEERNRLQCRRVERIQRIDLEAVSKKLERHGKDDDRRCNQDGEHGLPADPACVAPVAPQAPDDQWRGDDWDDDVRHGQECDDLVVRPDVTR
jgi:hypothetical protein